MLGTGTPNQSDSVPIWDRIKDVNIRTMETFALFLVSKILRNRMEELALLILENGLVLLRCDLVRRRSIVRAGLEVRDAGDAEGG